MQQFGAFLGSVCKGGSVIFLTGPLGAGKTTLTQAVAKAIGVKDNVNSPTFIIAREYTIKDATLVHADLYRVSTEDELISVGLLDQIGKPDTITVIEWPENQPTLERFGHLHITLSGEGDGRTVNIAKHGDNTSAQLWKELHEHYSIY